MSSAGPSMAAQVLRRSVKSLAGSQQAAELDRVMARALKARRAARRSLLELAGPNWQAAEAQFAADLKEARR